MSELAIDPRESLAEQSFEFYKNLYEESNDNSPQHQGLRLTEFKAALDDPRGARTDILLNDQLFLLPQLNPVDCYDWLNSEYYANTFPDDYAAGNVLHFADFPSIEPGFKVHERLLNLASQEGVLVFDHSSTDDEYEQRVIGMLDGLGIKSSEVKELGTQSYYVGQVSLKRPHETLNTPLGLISVFDKFAASDAYDNNRLINGASIVKSVDYEQATTMYEFYDAAFQVLNNHPCKQGLSPEEFLQIVTEDQDVAKVVKSAQGEIISLCILSEHLNKFPWVNPEYYATHYPDKYNKQQVVYFPALATSPDVKGGLNTQVMVNLIAELVEAGDNEILVAFDCCDFNAGFLDVFLDKMINKTPQAAISIKTIAKQHYKAVKLFAQ